MAAWDDFTATELKALRKEIQQSRGQLQTRFADRMVQWSSEEERRKIVSEISAAISVAESTTTMRRVYVNASKGFC